MKKENQGHSVFFLSELLEFPSVESAGPEGLVAVGGDLSSKRLLLAYHNGIFPWFNESSMILWWSPDPRMVLFPNEIKISKSMRKVLKDNRFSFTQNTCFEEVIRQCATIKRHVADGTWITDEMEMAYVDLHQLGYAKSFEVWEDKVLVGGLYGVDLGDVFCGESMFSKVSNASKFAFIQLAQWLQNRNYKLIDCQMYTPHLASMCAREIPRNEFLKFLPGRN